jgi:hypothetical protein
VSDDAYLNVFGIALVVDKDRIRAHKVVEYAKQLEVEGRRHGRTLNRLFEEHAQMCEKLGVVGFYWFLVGVEELQEPDVDRRLFLQKRKSKIKNGDSQGSRVTLLQLTLSLTELPVDLTISWML